MQGPFLSVLDILEAFSGDLNDTERVILDVTVNLIEAENAKCLIRDTTLIIYDKDSNTRRKLVHGTGQQLLYVRVYSSEEDRSYVKWENTGIRRIVKIKLNEDLWPIIIKYGSQFFAFCLLYLCIRYIEKKFTA